MCLLTTPLNPILCIFHLWSTRGTESTLCSFKFLPSLHDSSSRGVFIRGGSWRQSWRIRLSTKAFYFGYTSIHQGYHLTVQSSCLVCIFGSALTTDSQGRGQSAFKEPRLGHRSSLGGLLLSGYFWLITHSFLLDSWGHQSPQDRKHTQSCPATEIPSLLPATHLKALVNSLIYHFLFALWRFSDSTL